MQYHYVVMYDDNTGEWSNEDEARYLDGNVYDEAREHSRWFFPEEDSEDESRDYELRKELQKRIDLQIEEF